MYPNTTCIDEIGNDIRKVKLTLVGKIVKIPQSMWPIKIDRIEYSENEFKDYSLYSDSQVYDITTYTFIKISEE